MHDAIRGDVYLAIIRSGSATANDRAATAATLAQDVARFRADLAATTRLDLPSQVGAALAEVGIPLEAYIHEAT